MGGEGAREPAGHSPAPMCCVPLIGYEPPFSFELDVYRFYRNAFPLE
jgi:hypothetical protein